MKDTFTPTGTYHSVLKVQHRSGLLNIIQKTKFEVKSKFD